MPAKKEYRNARRSRKLIQNAFMELLHEKPYEKITATDVINRADVNRSTFYAHYPDLRGLVEEIMSEIVDESAALIEELDQRFHLRCFENTDDRRIPPDLSGNRYFCNHEQEEGAQ